MKSIVLIRHGQSLGQIAHANGLSRKDKSLVDCYLSERGVGEALALRSNETLLRHNFDLVCTSPLTRALATCVLALGHVTENVNSADDAPATPILAHSYISEAGKGVPENMGREVAILKKDLKNRLSSVSSNLLPCVDHIDFSLLPSAWPLVDDCCKSEKKLKLDLFLRWLMQRKEQNVAVVCHYNIIRWLLGNSIDRVSNCVPVECVLLEGAVPKLVLKAEYESGNIPIRKDSKRSNQKIRKGLSGS